MESFRAIFNAIMFGVFNLFIFTYLLSNISMLILIGTPVILLEIYYMFKLVLLELDENNLEKAKD